MTSTTDSSSTDYRAPLPTLLAFSLPGLPIGALAVALSVYLPRFYASHFNLGLQAVGLTFMAVRLADMLVDPVIGVMMDRTRTRLGRYRIWLMFGAPLLTIPVYMLFLAPAGVGYLYLLTWLFIYYLGTSVVTLSHVSWASVIASKYHDRSRVFGVLQVVSIIAATAVLLVPPLLHSKSQTSYVQIMGWFIVIVAPIGIAVATIFTPERIVQEHRTEKVTARDYWEMVSRPDMRRIIIADFCLTLGPGWMSALYLFYFVDARGFSFAQANYLLAIYIIAGVLGAAALSWAAIRFGKHRTLMCASTGYSLGLMSLSFIPRGAFPLAAVFMFLMGFLAAGFVLLGRAMTADVGDAVLLEKGKHRVGLLYAMMTSVEKIAAALAIGLTFVVLSWIGYNSKEGAVNTPASIHGLELVYLIGPIFFVMLGGACYIGYKLDHRRHAEIRAALEERNTMVPQAAAVEGLSGGQTLPGAVPEPT